MKIRLFLGPFVGHDDLRVRILDFAVKAGYEVVASLSELNVNGGGRVVVLSDDCDQLRQAEAQLSSLESNRKAFGFVGSFPMRGFGWGWIDTGKSTEIFSCPGYRLQRFLQQAFPPRIAPVVGSE